jgi:hypothetical protein
MASHVLTRRGPGGRQVFWLPLSSKQRNANMTLGVDPEANLMSSEAEEWATVQRLASDGAAATPTKKKSKPLDPRDGIKYLTAAQVGVLCLHPPTTESSPPSTY